MYKEKTVLGPGIEVSIFKYDERPRRVRFATNEQNGPCHVRDIYQRRVPQSTKGPALSLPFS